MSCGTRLTKVFIWCCDSPSPIPTSLGVHRIHTSTSHQRQGVASILLNAACKYGIYGMEVKKESDGVAFR